MHLPNHDSWVDDMRVRTTKTTMSPVDDGSRLDKSETRYYKSRDVKENKMDLYLHLNHSSCWSILSIYLLLIKKSENHLNEKRPKTSIKLCKKLNKNSPMSFVTR